MDDSRFNTKEAIAIILSVAVAHSLLSIPKSLLADQKSAAILNITFVSLLAIAFSYIIYKLLKSFPGKNILDISEFLGGKKFKVVLGILFLLYFTFSGSILLRNFCECIKVVYFANTKVQFIIAMFIASVIIVCSLNFKSHIKTNYIIMPIVLVSMIFLFISNLKNFSTSRMYPLLGDGFINTFITGTSNIYVFGGLVFLYFLPPLLKEPGKFKKISLISAIVSAIYIIMTISIVLFMFAYFVNINEIMPLFSAARNIEFGAFFQRLESVFLLIWLIVFACYLSIVVMFCLEIFKSISNIKDTRPLVPSFGLLFLAITLIPKNYAISNFLETHIYPYLNIGVDFILSGLILLLANYKLKKQR